MYSLRYWNLCVLLVAPVVTACGAPWFTDQTNQPILQHEMKSSENVVLGTLATTAQRRTILVSLNRENPARFCAEPSPDAAENIASNLSLLLEASARINEQGGSLKGEAAKSLRTAVKELTRRSQGIMFYRDGSYSLCQAYLNKILDSDEFSERLATLQQQSFDLIRQELIATGGIIGGNATEAEPKNPMQTKFQQLQQLHDMKKLEIVNEEQYAKMKREILGEDSF